MKLIISLTAILLPILFSIPLLVPAQSSQITYQLISGRILSQEDNQSVEGVTVLSKNSKNYTITNAVGNFTLRITANDDSLIISHINYAPREIAVNGNTLTPIVITLQRSSVQLTDVLVTTGYQTLPKERATGSFVVLDNELINRRVSTDIISRLEGITTR